MSEKSGQVDVKRSDKPSFLEVPLSIATYFKNHTQGRVKEIAKETGFAYETIRWQLLQLMNLECIKRENRIYSFPCSAKEMENKIRENRYIKLKSKGVVCPYCGSFFIRTRGKYRLKNGVRQRYSCLTCKKSFSLSVRGKDKKFIEKSPLFLLEVKRLAVTLQRNFLDLKETHTFFRERYGLLLKIGTLERWSNDGVVPYPLEENEGLFKQWIFDMEKKIGEKKRESVSLFNDISQIQGKIDKKIEEKLVKDKWFQAVDGAMSKVFKIENTKGELLDSINKLLKVSKVALVTFLLFFTSISLLSAFILLNVTPVEGYTKLENLGSTDIYGSLLITMEKRNIFGEWEYAQTLVNDTAMRKIKASDYLLEKSENRVKMSERGRYRVCVKLRNPKGDVLVNNDGSRVIGYYEISERK